MQYIYFVFINKTRWALPIILYAANRFIRPFSIFSSLYSHSCFCFFVYFRSFSTLSTSHQFFFRSLFDEYRILKGIRECRRKKNYEVITPKIFHKYILNLMQNSGMADCQRRRQKEENLHEFTRIKCNEHVIFHP